MITFNVGPSRVTDTVKHDMAAAAKEGILEISHRSKEFTTISQRAITGLRQLFSIPESYHVFYTSSATEAVGFAVTNTVDQNSYHFLQGNFSRLPYDIAVSLNKNAIANEVGWGYRHDFIGANIPTNTEFISITHNETSTGVACSIEDIRTVQNKAPNALTCVDITSSGGATEIDIPSADMWFFSLQKCFGLPAGLGIVIISDRAYQKSLQLTNEKKNLSGLFTFETLAKKMEGKYFTQQTPNVLGIYLLAQKVTRWNQRGGLAYNIEFTNNKWDYLQELIRKAGLTNFAQNDALLSRTVICAQGSEEQIKRIHEKAADQGVVLGSGYGQAKKTTIRIANFPSLSWEETQKLETILC